MNFDKREVATIIAALTLYRDANVDHEEEVNDIATQGWTQDAILRDDINDLISKVRRIMSAATPKAPRYLPIGTVINRTSNLSDQFRAVLEFAEEHCLILDKRANDRVSAARAHWNLDFDPDSDLSMRMFYRLVEALDSACPPFCGFGGHDGCSLDLGVWPQDDEIDQAVLEGGRMVKIVHPHSVEAVAPVWSWALIVNEDGSYRELWEREGAEYKRVWVMS